MRLAVWNCNMALHRKFDRLLSLKPDVAVICECASPTILRETLTNFATDQVQWMTAASEQKGLAVFAFGAYRLQQPIVPPPDPHIQVMLPLRVIGPTSFNLLATWAAEYAARIPSGQPGPLSRAASHYEQFLKADPAVFAGDFNNHRVFDRGNRALNFRNTWPRLNKLDLSSAYHASRGLTHEQDEPDPTLYWQRKKEKPYHIDYCFIPRSWLPRLRHVEVGRFEEWIAYSDHMPLVVEVNADVGNGLDSLQPGVVQGTEPG